MQSLFKSDFFVNNRRQLKKGAASDLIVISANGQLQRNSDVEYPFRQDSNFWYLTGLDEPDLLLVVDKTGEYLILPKRSSYLKIFHGEIDTSVMQKRSGVAEVLSYHDGWRRLKASLKDSKDVATLLPPPSYIEVYGMYTNPARRALLAKLKRIYPGLKLTDLRLSLARQRMIKQASELKAINQAIDITIDSLKEAIDQAQSKAYRFDYELEAQILNGFNRRGCRYPSFESVIAGGQNATNIHYRANGAELKGAELVVVDIGAEVENYAADITRTYCLNGQPTARQQAVFAAVSDVQARAISLLRPGVKLREYEQTVQAYMGQKLIELKLINKADRDSVRHYFPHLTSHFLGLDAHDAGDYDQPLQAGVVVTCEPGIYIADEGIAVRIEDDVLITENGREVLSQRLPIRLGLA